MGEGMYWVVLTIDVSAKPYLLVKILQGVEVKSSDKLVSIREESLSAVVALQVFKNTSENIHGLNSD